MLPKKIQDSRSLQGHLDPEEICCVISYARLSIENAEAARELEICVYLCEDGQFCLVRVMHTESEPLLIHDRFFESLKELLKKGLTPLERELMLLEGASEDVD